MDQFNHPRVFSLFEQANRVAAQATLPELFEGTLNLLAETGKAHRGLLFLFDNSHVKLVCQAAWGKMNLSQVIGMTIPVNDGIAEQVIHAQAPKLIENPAAHPGWDAGLGLCARLNGIWLPLCKAQGVIGLVLLLDCQECELHLLGLIANRMATDIDKAARLEAARQHEERLNSMLSIFQQIGSTLDRDQLLRMMIDYGRDVINAEACSLFLVDQKTHENVLYLASNVRTQIDLNDVRVPPGQGIIGHVVDTGGVVLIPDVSRDKRHYRKVDANSGFLTRAILAVPLRTQTLILGAERGTITTHVIGGVEAINKRTGTFDDDDVQVLSRLANQVATVLQIADLYSEVNELFLDVIQALAASIDAKDPYTEGHSQRVAEFSVAIGRSMGLDGELLHQVRIGSLLHDIGKIGIPDRILDKPGRLNDDEFQIMRQHPMIGMNIMRQVHRLHAELPALAEHHERLDGSGYPFGLKGDQVSLMGRIVAVADVFDALTSDRPYREALEVEAVMDYLYQQGDTQFDRRCLDALNDGLVSGEIQTQQMRTGN